MYMSTGTAYYDTAICLKNISFVTARRSCSLPVSGSSDLLNMTNRCRTDRTGLLTYRWHRPQIGNDLIKRLRVQYLREPWHLRLREAALVMAHIIA